MYRLLRPLLFRLDAEVAHHVGMWGLSLAELSPAVAGVMRKNTNPDRSSLKVRLGVAAPATVQTI